LPADEVETICQSLVDELQWEGPVFRISAMNKLGTRELCFRIMEFLEQKKADQVEEENPENSSLPIQE
jgi:GTP-binding protein